MPIYWDYGTINCVCVCVCVDVGVCARVWAYVRVHTGKIQIDCLAETDSDLKQWGGGGDVQRESIRTSQAMAGAISGK
jgi:hypothetical protein